MLQHYTALQVQSIIWSMHACIILLLADLSSVAAYRVYCTRILRKCQYQPLVLNVLHEIKWFVVYKR